MKCPDKSGGGGGVYLTTQVEGKFSGVVYYFSVNQTWPWANHSNQHALWKSDNKKKASLALRQQLILKRGVIEAWLIFQLKVNNRQRRHSSQNLSRAAKHRCSKAATPPPPTSCHTYVTTPPCQNDAWRFFWGYTGAQRGAINRVSSLNKWMWQAACCLI